MMSENEARTISIAGRSYRMRYTVNSLCALEDIVELCADGLRAAGFFSGDGGED